MKDKSIIISERLNYCSYFSTEINLNSKKLLSWQIVIIQLKMHISNFYQNYSFKMALLAR